MESIARTSWHLPLFPFLLMQACVGFGRLCVSLNHFSQRWTTTSCWIIRIEHTHGVFFCPTMTSSVVAQLWLKTSYLLYDHHHRVQFTLGPHFVNGPLFLYFRLSNMYIKFTDDCYFSNTNTQILFPRNSPTNKQYIQSP